jgi:hypothetical protein
LPDLICFLSNSTKMELGLTSSVSPGFDLPKIRFKFRTEVTLAFKIRDSEGG